MFLSWGDTNRIVYEDDLWKIQEHCNRGYFPWFTLHKKRKLLMFSWWSSTYLFGEYKPLIDFINRWNNWNEYE